MLETSTIIRNFQILTVTDFLLIYADFSTKQPTKSVVNNGAGPVSP